MQEVKASRCTGGLSAPRARAGRRRRGARAPRRAWPAPGRRRGAGARAPSAPCGRRRAGPARAGRCRRRGGATRGPQPLLRPGACRGPRRRRCRRPSSLRPGAKRATRRPMRRRARPRRSGARQCLPWRAFSLQLSTLRSWVPHCIFTCSGTCRLCCTPLEKAAPVAQVSRNPPHRAASSGQSQRSAHPLPPVASIFEPTLPIVPVAAHATRQRRG